MFRLATETEGPVHIDTDDNNDGDDAECIFTYSIYSFL
jgi:hypothetical protein